jgi:hypothetical protein
MRKTDNPQTIISNISEAIRLHEIALMRLRAELQIAQYDQHAQEKPTVNNRDEGQAPSEK